MAPTALDDAFTIDPSLCKSPDVAVIGAGLGLDAARQLVERVPGTNIVVLDRGPLDLLSHFANSALPRVPLLRRGTDRVGGRSLMWGLAIPDVRLDRLRQWPYDLQVVQERFTAFGGEMGRHDAIPYSGRALEQAVENRLGDEFADTGSMVMERAPLAMDRTGHRWSVLDRLSEAIDLGVRIVSRAHCERIDRHGHRVVRIHGTRSGKPFVMEPGFVVLATGTENALPLLDQIASGLPLSPADHIRIDCSGWLPPTALGSGSPEEAGISTLCLHFRSPCAGTPYHLEVKAAPRTLWRRNMQSGDNLIAHRDDPRILVQIQAIAEMHDRLPVASLVRDLQRIHPAMSQADLEFHSELGAQMGRVGGSLGLVEPQFVIRPLLGNHHLYGILRVDQGLTPALRLEHLENAFVLAPTAFVGVDDDANPMLKSRVLNSFAVDCLASLLE